MKNEVKVCPFCGKIPKYDEKSELVHCLTPECAIGDFYIHIEEWNKRYVKASSNGSGKGSLTP